MIEYLLKIDWATFLAFAVTVLTLLCTTVITIKHQKRALDSQIAISRESSDRDREKSRAEFIANSRQLWINSLRDEVANFISNTSIFIDLHQQKAGRAQVLAELKDPVFAMTELANWSVAYGTAVSKAEKSIAKIELLLNPTEAASINLMKTVNAAYKSAKDFQNASNKNADVILALQPILKSEWERVKAQDSA